MFSNIAFVVFCFIVILLFGTEPLWIVLLVIGLVVCLGLGALMALVMWLDSRRRPGELSVLPTDPPGATIDGALS